MGEKITVGLVAAPELAEQIAYKLKKILSESFKKHISDGIEWEVEIAIDPLTGAAETVDEIFQETTTYRSNNTWDFIVCLTDLPIFHEKKVVAVDINERLNISIVSIPAFGFSPFVKRIQKSIIFTLKTMYQKVGAHSNVQKDTNSHTTKTEITKLLKRSFPISPVRKVRLWMKETGDVHTRIIIVPRFYGSFYLLLGMTTANNPFKVMSSLTNVVAIAFTTGVFGMAFTTIWELSHIFSNWRLTGIMIAAIFGMVVWISVAQELWEPRSTDSDNQIRKLYNLTTAMTLLAAIGAYYVVVFMLFSVTAFVMIPPDLLAETLGLDATPTIVNYFKIAWFAASLSIVAGAIGAGLANEELVRNSTYGYRQRKRYEEKQNK